MESIAELYTPPIIAAFGNPLLDSYIVIDDLAILDKYGVHLDEPREISKDELPMLHDIRKKCVLQSSAGGSSLNTLRMLQWLIKCPHYSVFFGGIGIDEEGAILKDLVDHSGILARYAYHDELPTGACVSFISGEQRSLIAYLGAANVYERHHLNTKENWEILKNVRMVYIEGFFLSHSYTAALEVVQFCKKHSIALGFNISATYVCNNYPQEVAELVRAADLVFGNKPEYLALGKVFNLTESDVYSVAKYIQSLESNKSDQTSKFPVSLPGFQDLGKVVVVTEGKSPVVCVSGNNILTETPVPDLASGLIKDTTGAGDSFVAGFLLGLFERKCLEKCIYYGSWTAQQVIQHIGVKVPAYPPERLKNL